MAAKPRSRAVVEVHHDARHLQEVLTLGFPQEPAVAVGAGVSGQPIPLPQYEVAGVLVLVALQYAGRAADA